MDKLRSEDDLRLTMKDNYWCAGQTITLFVIEGMPKAIIPFREWCHANLSPDTLRSKFEEQGSALLEISKAAMTVRTIRVCFPAISDEDWMLIKLKWFRKP